MPLPLSPLRLLLLLLVLCVIWFGNLEQRKLALTDEGRYAEIPREMVASGDWTTPRLNGFKYFEKPALQYWATASAYTLFGQHHWTARLWTALTGLLGILAVYLAGRRLFGPQAGLYAGLALGSSLLWVGMGHMNTLDMGVAFFMGLGLCAFLLAQHAGASRRENALWMHVVWASLALSVLSKGLIGLVLPGAVMVLYTLIQRDWGLWRRLHLLSGLVLFFIIAAPWFVAVSLANPDFFHFFFIHEHFERFLTKVHRRDEPWWYFFPIFVLGILPWLIPALDALRRAWNREGERKNFHPGRFLLIWAVFIFFFFSISSSKLPSYILPVFPALALLTGRHLAGMSGKTLFWQMLPMALLAIVGLWFSSRAANLAGEESARQAYAQYGLWAAWTAAFWLAGLIAGLVLAYRQRAQLAILIFGFTALLAAQSILSGHDLLARTTSTYYLAQQIRPHLKPETPLYSIGTYEQTLPFYLDRTLTLVAYQDEMAFGIGQEPHKWIADIPAFERKWRTETYALAIMLPETYQQLKNNGLPMKEIARDTKRVVVATP
ncbi:MAG: phospholipid carrier-dependent glycosyltransferase [Nitrosomonadales bacterium]|nr:MAG: phospholipid carrier-dependent glycosyltransferase [Nitrosomonadales bacterium]